MNIKVLLSTPEKIKQLVFDLLDILYDIGIPVDNKTDRRLERMAKACLAVGQVFLTPDSHFNKN